MTRSSSCYWQEEKPIFHKSNKNMFQKGKSKTMILNAVDRRKRSNEKKPFNFIPVDYL